MGVLKIEFFILYIIFKQDLWCENCNKNERFLYIMKIFLFVFRCFSLLTLFCFSSYYINAKELKNEEKKSLELVEDN